MPQLRLALAQVNAVVGDVDHNVELVVSACHEAARAGAHLVVFPEMVLTGYPVEDLAGRLTLIRRSQEAIAALPDRLAKEGLGDLVAVVGHLDSARPGEVEAMPERLGVPKNAPTNSASVISAGQVVARYDKHHLPNYGVFDEFRNFVPGEEVQIVQVHGVDVAIAICEDIWQDGPSAAAKAAEAGLLLVLNGSPYEAAKDDTRLELCARRAREGACALAYVNLVGGQDELVFDGDSLVVDSEGELVARAAQFVPELLVADLDLAAATAPMPDPGTRVHGLLLNRVVVSSDPVPPYAPRETTVAERWDDLGERYQAIVLGLRDYVEKNGFRSVLLGLSGGIDSTLAAAVAVDALGADRVFGVSNPSEWSTEHSRSDAAELARRTGLQLDTVPIAPIFGAYQDALDLDGLAEENLQARIRAVIWMGLSNQHGHLVLACGNKSELATGYSTIYGDAVGGYAPLKDVPKTIVWELARWRNAWAEARGEQPPIPENTISKPPSAELRPGQLDTDSLPPYDVLDGILDAYVERDLGAKAVVEEGFDPAVVQQVVTLVDRAEYKRRQYPPGPKISARNFGRDRRVPITNRWREEL
ncbi:NAD+ synthase [Aeromicrobium phragmitis]|uniref:Glutamine-dependent NAD(+) synthetase n=1 Tax=Aeromicrobium phragmitis TaxID=2478914 RepID=A0A3L8PPP7_9ACTN|nr:NAD+ synthase [Aeromicrobium phragmitis]RLV55992.1 NAD+ synthase [Aeromicrobium phragmitis]